MTHPKILALTTGMCIAAGIAFAHHSGALYDLTRTASVKGTVKAFLWTNPHVVLMVTSEAKENQPGQEWRFEMTSPGRLTRSGWTKRSLQASDSITVEYNPMRDGSRVGWVRKVTSPEGKVMIFDAQGEDKPNLP